MPTLYILISLNKSEIPEVNIRIQYFTASHCSREIFSKKSAYTGHYAQYTLCQFSPVTWIGQVWTDHSFVCYTVRRMLVYLLAVRAGPAGAAHASNAWVVGEQVGRAARPQLRALPLLQLLALPSTTTYLIGNLFAWAFNLHTTNVIFLK